jgi:hypothetical protein
VDAPSSEGIGADCGDDDAIETTDSPPITSTEQSLKPATASLAVKMRATADASRTPRPTAPTRSRLRATAAIAAVGQSLSTKSIEAS